MTTFFLLIASQMLARAEAPHFYPESYLESRTHLYQVAENWGESKAPPVSRDTRLLSREKSITLTIDSLYFPPSMAKKNLLIVTSATHGAEGFAGAAIQFAFIQNYLKFKRRETTGVLIVHGVNPHGFHQKRRVDKNNVDLNRNFLEEDKDFRAWSSDYHDFEDYLNPTTPASSDALTTTRLFMSSLLKLITHGKKTIAQISVGGQYQNPKGIYFGGDEPSENVKLIQDIFKAYGEDYEKILHIDLHTGYGVRGQLHFFISRKTTEMKGFASLFKGFDIDLGSDKDFYETSGAFEEFTKRVFKDKAVVIPMTFEFGTLDSQTIWGGFQSLKNMIYENQGFHYGYRNPESEQKIKRDFSEMFNPSEKQWRRKVVKSGSETLDLLLNRLEDL